MHRTQSKYFDITVWRAIPTLAKCISGNLCGLTLPESVKMFTNSVCLCYVVECLCCIDNRGFKFYCH